jgi:hypothetical protein
MIDFFLLIAPVIARLEAEIKPEEERKKRTNSNYFQQKKVGESLRSVTESQ